MSTFYKQKATSIRHHSMRLAVLLSFCIAVFPLCAQTSLDNLLRTEKLQTGSFSIYAMDAETGKTLYASPQKSLSTASVMKLFTTAVALDVLGPDYTFTTSLYYAGKIDQTGTLNGNLILKGGGDPAFYSSWFEDHYRDCFGNWVSQLKSAGIKRIDGQLLLDLSAMDRTAVPGGWNWGDIGNYYGAGVSALTYRDNLYEIHFSSPKNAGEPVPIKSFNPEMPLLSLENLVCSSAQSVDNTSVYGAPGSWSQYVRGTIPTNNPDFVTKATMPDPPVVAAEALLKKIGESEMTITGGIVRLTAADTTGRILVSSFQSPPLKEIIVPLNKESLNLFAEHLLREIGRKKYGEPSMEKGLEAYRQFCTEKGIETQGFFPEDGSGLTRANVLTTKTLVDILKLEYDGPLRDLFFNSLPVAGVDGTLKNSLKETPLEKNLRAKTGSMTRVRSIAGIMKSRSGKTILLAVILNNFNLTSPELSKLRDSILLALYND